MSTKQSSPQERTTLTPEIQSVYAERWNEFYAAADKVDAAMRRYAREEVVIAASAEVIAYAAQQEQPAQAYVPESAEVQAYAAQQAGLAPKSEQLTAAQQAVLAALDFDPNLTQREVQ